MLKTASCIDIGGYIIKTVGEMAMFEIEASKFQGEDFPVRMEREGEEEGEDEDQR